MCSPKSQARSRSRAWWQPQESGWIPSISAGWGLTSFNSNDYDLTEFEISPKQTSQDWMVGLGWKDAFIKGNLLGFAIGQPQFETARDSGTPDDGNYALELFYQFQVTDNISITPAAFYVSRPFGELTGTNDTYGGTGAESFGTFGYLVKTSFKF